MKRTYTKEVLELMNLFERATGARLVDCLESDDATYFVVASGDIGKAIGKGGSTAKQFQERLRRKIKIIEYREDPLLFVRSALYPIQPQDVSLREGVVSITLARREEKGLVIGRSAKNLNTLKDLVRRYFDQVKDIVVV